MEEPVDHEVRDLAVKRPPRGPGLPARRVERDVDLAQEHGPLRIPKLRGLGQGEREHVGGAVGVEVIAVQVLERRVPGQDQRYRGAGASEPAERRAEERPKSGRS
jgi:hypothetical protein